MSRIDRSGPYSHVIDTDPKQGQQLLVLGCALQFRTPRQPEDSQHVEATGLCVLPAYNYGFSGQSMHLMMSRNALLRFYRRALCEQE
jgi:hypothetical protein